MATKLLQAGLRVPGVSVHLQVERDVLIVVFESDIRCRRRHAIPAVSCYGARHVVLLLVSAVLKYPAPVSDMPIVAAGFPLGCATER